ncbi:hypothetical protein FQR65_LT02510 [Abscondita terminalis]|nr:hypothetical protein FQR65_LT02510 [Abscondita terminalis]
MAKNGIIQWGWPEIEELLQCPVCLDIPASGPGVTVEQCIHGHHICFNCKVQVENCPLCKCAFHGTRNFVVEELVRHFEILKNTMLLNNMVLDTKPKKKKKIKLNADAPEFAPKPLPVRRNVHTPAANRGLYPCRVGDCVVSLPSSRLLNHVRSFHSNNLTESVVDLTDSYNQVWEVTIKNKKPITKITFVVFVSGIGLVFLNIETLRSGHLILAVQTAMKCRQAQEFLATVELFSEKSRLSYSTRLVSVRDNIIHMLQAKTCFVANKAQVNNLCVNKKFNCRLRLSRYNNLDFNLLTVGNPAIFDYVAMSRASLIEEENKEKAKAALPTKNGKSVPSNQQSSSFNGTSLNEILTVDLQPLLHMIRDIENLQHINTTAGASTKTVAKKKKNKKHR